MPFATSVRVFVCQGGWTCRYCAAKTIAPPVLRVVSRLHPQDFPYHPNWKAGQVHPAYLLTSTTLDHVVPGTRGGALARSRQPCHVLLAVQLEQGRLHAGRDPLALASGARDGRRMGWACRPLRGAVGASRQTRRRLSRSLVSGARASGSGHLTFHFIGSCLVPAPAPRRPAQRDPRDWLASTSATGPSAAPRCAFRNRTSAATATRPTERPRHRRERRGQAASR